MRCPVCGNWTLASGSREYKECLNLGCTARVHPDGVISTLRHFPLEGKIKRVKKFHDGKEETVREYKDIENA